MENVLIDLRKYDLADRLGLDMISVEALLSKLEDALNEIDKLKEDDEYPEPDAYDIWHDRNLMEE
jgi:hypothetical protein